MDLNKQQRKKLGKWLIGIITVCVIIYLGLKNINVIGNAVSWVFGLFAPLILGLVFALILNVPMRFFEGLLWKKAKRKFALKFRRPVAYILSLVMILGIFTGIIWLVIPELINAFTVVAKGALSLVNNVADMDKDSDIYIWVVKAIEYIDLKSTVASLQSWLANAGSTIMSSVIATAVSLVGGIFDFFISFIFSIYILFAKETLKAQMSRLVKAWLPRGLGGWLIHASSVASGIFRNFVSGQTIEALILGVLCMLGMFILQLPYAPMVGALVGVTALIPVVGAYIGAFVGAFMIITVSPIKTVIFLVFLIILQQVEGNIIYPKVMGSRVNLPALWILAAVTVGGAMAGPVGMLLGVPVASTAYVLLREATEDREDKLKAEELLDDNNDTIIELE